MPSETRTTNARATPQERAEQSELSPAPKDPNLSKAVATEAQTNSASHQVKTSERSVEIPNSGAVTVACIFATGGRMASTLDSNTTSLSNNSYSIRRRTDGTAIVEIKDGFAGELFITSGSYRGQLKVGSVEGAVPAKVSNPSTTTKLESKPPTSTAPNLHQILTRDFARYTETIYADQNKCRGVVTWQACQQEYLQIVSDYQKITGNGATWPTTREAQQKLLALSGRLNDLLDHYDERRDATLKAAERTPSKPVMTSDISTMKEMPWQSRQSELFSRLKSVYEKIEARRVDRSKEPSEDQSQEISSEKRFIETTNKFAEISNSHRHDNDPKMMSTMLKHWEFAVDQFVAPRTKSANGLFNVEDNLSALGSMKQQIIDWRYSGKTAPIELREQLMKDASMIPAPVPTAKQLESLLFMDSRFAAIAGPVLPGEGSPHFNYADTSALAQKLAGDRIANPNQLAADAIAKIGISPTSQEARGVRIGLGVEGLTADEQRQMTRAQNFVDRHPRLNGPIARAAKAGLAEAHSGLARAHAAGVQIKGEVPAIAEKSLEGALQPIGVIRGDRVDPTPRTVTESEMRLFQHHAAVVATMSNGNLKSIEQLSGTKISTFLPHGISQDFIRFMVGSVTLAHAPTGIPPGVALRLVPDTALPTGSPAQTKTVGEQPKKNGFGTSEMQNLAKKLWGAL